MTEPQNVFSGLNLAPEASTALHEAQETVEAIRQGEVDAFVMREGEQDGVFIVRGAYHPYRVFVEKMNEGAVTLSTDGTILYANQSFAALVKAPHDRIIGEPIESFAVESEAVAKILRADGAGNFEMLLRGSDGAAVPVYTSHSRIRSGETCWICLIVIDLTEQKRQQAALQQNERLAAMGMTAAVLSHEIANPLMSISASVQLMQRQIARSVPIRDLAENLRLMESEVNRLTELLEDFRSLSHPTQLTCLPTNFGDFIVDSLKVIGTAAANAAVHIQHEISAEIPPVFIDQRRMKQVILNLCKNAIEAMPKGGELIIRVSRQNGEIVIEISDTGPGISEEIDIFELFTTTKSTGTGLGLAIVRQIVAAHGGSIRYNSNPGQGTTFYVSLPVRAPDGSASV